MTKKTKAPPGNPSGAKCEGGQPSRHDIIIPTGSSPANDAQARLLSYLQWTTATTTETQRGCWVGIHSDELRRVGGKHYAQHMRDLATAEKIEINHRYAVQRFSKSYRLTRRYRTGDYERYQPHRASASTHRIRLDDTDTVGHLLAQRLDSLSLPPGLRCTGWDHYATQSIRDHRYYAVRCPYGRYHTTYTGLPRSVRRQLHASSEQVIEIDVANCQPLTIGMVAATQAQSTPPTNTTQQPTTNTHNTICRTLADLRDYLDTCCAGQLYEVLTAESITAGMTLWDIIPPRYRHRHATDRPLRRADIKRQFIILMFADLPTTKRLPLYRIVATRWPTIAAYILAAKQDDYRQLAHRCQRFESALMVGPDGVADRFIDAAPDAPIVTIHDAIVTTPRYADLARDIIRDRFGEAGATPTVSID